MKIFFDEYYTNFKLKAICVGNKLVDTNGKISNSLLTFIVVNHVYIKGEYLELHKRQITENQWLKFCIF